MTKKHCNRNYEYRVVVSVCSVHIQHETKKQSPSHFTVICKGIVFNHPVHCKLNFAFMCTL